MESESSILIRDQSRPVVTQKSPVHAELLGLSESAFLEQTNSIAESTNQAVAFPDLWNETGRCVAGVEEKHPVVRPLHRVPGLEKVGQDLLLMQEMVPYGKIDMPGVGKLRVLTTILRQEEEPERLILINPGFKQTHEYFLYRWFLYYFAQIAKQLKADIVIADPEGRTVPGFDEAKGVARISRNVVYEDTNAISNKVVSRYLDLTHRDAMDVILYGHSMGAKLARGTARDLLRRPTGTGDVRLRGIIQDAPRAASTLADFFTKTYFKAILPHLGGTAKGILLGERGCEIEAGDVLRIFTNETTIENLRAAIAGMARSSWRYFLEETVGSGDMEDFQQTLRIAANDLTPNLGGLGTTILHHGSDRVFSPGASADMAYPPGTTLHLPNMPHCHPAFPTKGQLEGMRKALSFAFKVTLEHPTNLREF